MTLRLAGVAISSKTRQQHEPRSRRSCPGFIALVGLLLLAPVVVSAAVMVRMPLDDLIRGSTVVVHGKVVSSTPFRNEENGRIYTSHVVEVLEYLRGDGDKSIRVVTMGGELEDFGQIVPGEAKLAVGEEVVLCLLKAPEHDGFVVYGMSQGKFRVEKHDEKEVLVRDYKGILFIGEKNALSPKVTNLPFETFRQLVKSLAK